MSGQHLGVLIVEDQEDHALLVRALIEEGLRDAQLSVTQVETGMEALRLLENGSFDICLLDYQLGEGIDGLGVLETARVKGVETPIVLLTAAGDEAVAVQAMKAGASDYLRKEALSPELLRSTLLHVLALHEEEKLRKKAEEELRQAKDTLELKLQELNDANEHLRRLSRLKDDFVGSISHELRTPIANIKLSHQLLVAHPDARDTYLATLRRETDRLHSLIEELLNVARMAMEPPELKLAKFDLNAMVLLYVADRTLLAEQQGLSLTFREELGLPTIKADRMQLERVLGILLNNALSYTPEGGKVEVATHSQQVEGESWAGFSVKDTGLGIPVEEQERLFERFFRGKAALERGVPGTGLGLSIARGIVEEHGGKLEVSSTGEPGKGATFSIWLPTGELEEGHVLSTLAKHLKPRSTRQTQRVA